MGRAPAAAAAGGAAFFGQGKPASNARHQPPSTAARFMKHGGLAVATGSTAERNHLGTAAPVAEGVDTDLTLRIPGNLPGLIRNKESLDQEKVHGLSVSESGRLHACKYFLSRLDTRRVEWGMQAPATSRGAHHCSVCEAVRFTRACTHRRAHTCVHTHAHARAHTHTHTYTHTLTHTQNWSLNGLALV